MFVREPFATRGGKQKTHVNMIAKPERESDVPAIPKVADVASNKRMIKVLRRVDAKQITEGDGKSAVTREIEK